MGPTSVHGQIEPVRPGQRPPAGEGAEPGGAFAEVLGPGADERGAPAGAVPVRPDGGPAATVPAGGPAAVGGPARGVGAPVPAGGAGTGAVRAVLDFDAGAPLPEDHAGAARSVPPADAAGRRQEEGGTGLPPLLPAGAVPAPAMVAPLPAAARAIPAPDSVKPMAPDAPRAAVASGGNTPALIPGSDTSVSMPTGNQTDARAAPGRTLAGSWPAGPGTAGAATAERAAPGAMAAAMAPPRGPLARHRLDGADALDRRRSDPARAPGGAATPVGDAPAPARQPDVATPAALKPPPGAEPRRRDATAPTLPPADTTSADGTATPSPRPTDTPSADRTAAPSPRPADVPSADRAAAQVSTAAGGDAASGLVRPVGGAAPDPVAAGQPGLLAAAPDLPGLPPVHPHPAASTGGPPAGQAAQIAHQVMEALVSARDSAAAGRVIDVTLSPEELGRVRLSLSGDDGALAVLVRADRDDTLALMRRHIDALGQDLRAAGYGSVSFSFSGERAAGQGHDAPRAPDPPGAAIPDPLPALSLADLKLAAARSGAAGIAGAGLDLRL